MERWLEAFTGASYFTATVTFTEHDPLQVEESVTVGTKRTPAATIPDLWRISTTPNARRFSWLDDPASIMQVVRTSYLHIWRARNPFRVFGTITTRHVLLPETRYWEAKGCPPEA